MKVACIHFWDTRSRTSSFWEHMRRMLYHNYVTVDDPRVDHLLCFNDITNNPIAQDVANAMQFDDSIVFGDSWDAMDKRHLVVFNKVATVAYRWLDLSEYDRVMLLMMDHILINHTPAPFIDVLEEVMATDSPLALPNKQAERYHSVGHTLPPGRPIERFSHNPMFYFDTCVLPDFESAIRDTERSYEVVLRPLPCVYMKPNSLFNWVSYHSYNNEDSEVFEIVKDRSRTSEIWEARL